jgi:hypothetical protein
MAAGKTRYLIAWQRLAARCLGPLVACDAIRCWYTNKLIRVSRTAALTAALRIRTRMPGFIRRLPVAGIA